MNLKNFRALVEVVDQGGFGHAAKVLASTQSTVSKAVRQLERDLGATLLDRSGHRARLTAAGEIAYASAVRLLAERAALAAQLGDVADLRRGRLRLGLPPVAGSLLFAPVMAQYVKRYPGVEIHLVEQGAERMTERLRAGEIELAAVLRPLPDEFDALSVDSQPLVAVLSRRHPLAERATLGVEQLRELPFVMFEEGFGINRIVLEACRARGFEPQVAARSSQVDFVVELAAAGVGVAFLPRRLAASHRNARVRQLTLRPASMSWDLAMIWRRHAVLSRAAEAWLALVRGARPAG